MKTVEEIEVEIVRRISWRIRCQEGIEVDNEILSELEDILKFIKEEK